MPRRVRLPWLALGGLIPLVGFAGGFLVWLFSLQAIDQEIDRTRSALKPLRLGGQSPDHQLIGYLDAWPLLEKQYQSVIQLVAPLPLSIEGQLDPQLYFQQRFHEVQRALERLAAARGMTTPVQLGFPKELPPLEVVPRLLIQLDLIEDAAELILAQGVSQLMSLKVEDPQPDAFPGRESRKTEAFLTRLPIRVRMSCSLEALTKVLGVLDHAKPLIDLQSLRIASPTNAQVLEVELVVARYLLTEPALEPPEQEPLQAPAASRTKKPS